MSVQEYLDKHLLSRKIEDAVNAAVRAKSSDPVLFIANHMKKSVPSVITKVIARQILDSRGIPTVEVDLHTNKGVFRASAPGGVSSGMYEAVELRDKDPETYLGNGVTRAVTNINEKISEALIGMDPTLQSQIDQAMIDLDKTEKKSELGANAILAVSIAACKAGAAEKEVPLYKHIADLSGKTNLILPVPAFTLISGGKHAGNNLAVQEIMILPVGAKRFEEAVRMGAETYHHLKAIIKDKYGASGCNVGEDGGLAPNISSFREGLDLVKEAISRTEYNGKIKIAINVAATDFCIGTKYDLDIKSPNKSGQDFKSGEDMIEMYKELCADYPIVSIEDPFDKEDWEHVKIFSSLGICQKFITLDRSFKDVLLGSIKPITLNVTPGDEVILENIILDEDERVDPSLVKGFHEEFNDKYVCIFLLPMSRGHKNSMVLDTTRLRDVHEQIKSFGGKFNVICVPTHVEHNKNGFEYFNPYQEHFEIKCCTSFYHISIDDSACLKRMESMIGIPKDPKAAYVILGPVNGSCRKVVTILDSDFIKWHGAKAFPFTTEKIQQLAHEDVALWSGKHDLGTLLSLPDRDFVISNDCTKVPISDLHQRTVCLLFYEDTLECRNWTEKLKKLYVARKDFEVVVVFSITFGHDHSVELENRRRLLKFWKVFGEMPWLALPLDDPKCRQLWRIFNKLCSDTPKLLIIYSGGKYFEENGFKVMEETGFENYPFMREKVIRTSVAVKEKNLSSFLGRNELIRGRDLDYVGREKFTVSKLLGVSVVLLFLGVPDFRGFSDLLTGLHFNHRVSAGGVERFEIVYIPMTESPSEIVPDCDWMLVSPCKEHLIPSFHLFFEDEINQNPGKQFTMAMVSFGQFGHYNDRGIIYTNCSKAAYKLFLDTFPFKDNEEKESFKLLYSAAINKPRKKTDD